MMKERSCILLLYILLLWGLSACRDDSQDGEDPASFTPVNLEVTTRAGGEADGAVTSLRLVVAGYTTGSLSGTVSYNRLIEMPGTTTGFNVKARKGANSFYLIANETPEMTALLDAANTAADVEQFRVTFRPPKTGEQPVMFGKKENVNVVVANDADATATVTYTDDNGVLQSGQSTLPLSATRIGGKFSVTFIKKAASFTVKNLNFKVLRIPAYSYLGEGQPYPGTAWSTESLPQSSTGALNTDNTAVWNASTKDYTYGGGDKVAFADFYLPEHLPQDAHKGEVNYSTVLLVNGTCVVSGGREQDANWQVNLMSDGFRIKRNTHYRVAVSITGMGAMGMAAEVMPVEEHDIPVNWGVSEGLVVLSDRTADYGKNISVANDVNAYSGILKVVKTLNGKATYHDALFKYGSVIGVATATAGTAYAPATDVLYDPKLSGSSYLLDTWASLPAADATTTGDNTLGGLKRGLGDPCRLVGVTSRQMEQGRYSNGLWHTATPEELERLVANGDHADGVAADNRGFLAFSELLVPVWGYRNTSGVAVADGGQGRYWSSGEAKRLLFAAASPQGASVSAGNVQEAYTVRCVRNNIPQSKITAANATVGYTGGSITIPVSSNVPRWKAEVITAANNNGGVSNVGDPSGVTLQTLSGGYNGSLSVTVPRRALSSDRNCYLRITGTGYDGTEAKHIVNLLQNRLEWRATIVSNTMNDVGNQLPAAGGSYTAVVKVTPEDAEAFPADTKCTFTISASGATSDIVQADITVDRTTQQVSINYTISANPLPDIRLVNLKFEFLGTGINCRVEQSKIQAK